MEASRSPAKTLRGEAANRPQSTARVILPARSWSELVGREDDVQSIAGELLTERTCRLVVHGDAGVGKTSVALEAAHRIAESGRYTLIVWFACHAMHLSQGRLAERTLATSTVSDILRELAHHLGEGSALREGTDRERMQLLRARLAEERSLLIIDDVDELDEETLADFLSSLPSAVDVLGTSRVRLPWSSQRRLDPLADEEASLLIDRTEVSYDSTESEQFEEWVLSLGSGVPLTILQLCDLLREGLAPDEIEGQLRDSSSDIHRYYFERRWQTIQDEPYLLRAMLLLAMAGAPLSAETVSGALGPPARKGTAALRGLARDLNVVTERAGEYSLLPLTRQFITSRLTEYTSDVNEVLRSLFVSLKARLSQAAALESRREYLESIDTWRPELLACLRLGLQADRDGAAIGATMVAEAAYYLYARGFWRDLLLAADWAVPAAATNGDLDSVLEVGLTWSVKAVRERDGIAQAERAETRWMSELVVAGLHPQKEARVRIARASVARRRVRGRALLADLVWDALALEAEGHIEWACRAMLRAGLIWSGDGFHKDAREAFKWVEDRARRASPVTAWSTEMTALAACNAGILANREGKYETAVRLLESGLPNIAQSYEEATARGELAVAFYGLEDSSAAAHHLRKCVAIRASLGISESVVESYPGWELEKESRLLVDSITPMSSQAGRIASAVYRVRAFILRRRGESS